MSFSLTRKTDYALVALARLAREGVHDHANPDEKALSARQIAQEFNLPAPLLMNVLKDLHKAGIVCSRRGPTGGYMLCCHDPAKITMLEIVEAIEGPVSVAVCCDEEAERTAGKEPCLACRAQPKCPNVNAMERFNGRVREFLSSITLQDLLSDTQAASRRSQVVLGVSA